MSRLKVYAAVVTGILAELLSAMLLWVFTMLQIFDVIFLLMWIGFIAVFVATMVLDPPRRRTGRWARGARSFREEWKRYEDECHAK